MTNRLDLRPLYLFVQVAEAGSFSKAAAILTVGQPALSREIKDLEQRYDVQLLHRNGRGVSLTDAGEQLLTHAKGLLRGLEQAEQELLTVRGTVSGHVAIGVPPLFGHVLNFSLVKTIRARHPKVALTFMEGFTTDFLEWLAKGAIDLAVMYNPPNISTLIAEHLHDDRLCLVGLPHSLKQRVGSELPCRALAGLPMVMAPRPHRLRVAADDAAKEAGITLNVVVGATGTATILDLVRGEVGFTILPESLIRADVKAKALAAWPLKEPVIAPRLFLVTSMQRPLTAATNAVIEAVRQRFGRKRG